MTPTDPTDIPLPLRAALEGPSPEVRGWQGTPAAQLIGLFLWVAFFDQLPAETLGRSTLLWPVVGLGLGGALAYVCLYRPPALWGHRIRRPIAVVAARGFGVRGATIVPGLALALVQVVWIAVAVGYGTTLGLAGIERLGLLEPGFRRTLTLGSVSLPGPLFLSTSLLWCVATVLAGRYLIRVIAALMNVYPVIPALMLGITAAVAMRGLPEYQARVGQPGGPEALGAGLRDVLTATQYVLAFFSTSALLCADWGAVLRTDRDVEAGGSVGVALASWVVGTLALISVAGVFPRLALDAADAPGAIRAQSYAQALTVLVPGRAGGLMLIGFALTALAPACYAGFLLSERLNLILPALSRTRWALLAIPTAWALLASGLVSRLLPVFGLVGAVFAPVAGVIAADYVRSRGVWTGARRGWNVAGLLAWAVGLAVGAAPVVAGLFGIDRLSRVQPAAVLGFLAAALSYLLAAAAGAETAEEPAVGPAPPPEVSPAAG